jgi:branched-chain amino acid transport system ATP-binding protein
MALLEVSNLIKKFGGLTACDNVSFKIEKGEIAGLIGPNGAGKTTLFNSLVGYYKPNGGIVLFKGENITGLKPFHTNRKGLARTFQIPAIMGDMTVLENTMVGAFCRTNDEDEARNKALEILMSVRLDRERDAYPTELPIATQKRIELARALATKPDLLMLDEMASGLTKTETEDIMRMLVDIKDGKELTLFIIEHVMEFVMPISDRVLVLDGGKKIAEGKPEEIVEMEEVVEAYLGEKYVKSE